MEAVAVMKMFTIYLAGTIGGLRPSETEGWRRTIEMRLGLSFNCLSPLRFENFPDDEPIDCGSKNGSILYEDRWTFARALNDVKRSDAVLANVLDSPRVSIGTVMEIAWAYLLGVPVFLVAGEGDPHAEHPMISQAVVAIARTIEDGERMIQEFLYNRR